MSFSEMLFQKYLMIKKQVSEFEEPLGTNCDPVIKYYLNLNLSEGLISEQRFETIEIELFGCLINDEPIHNALVINDVSRPDDKKIIGLYKEEQLIAGSLIINPDFNIGASRIYSINFELQLLNKEDWVNQLRSNFEHSESMIQLGQLLNP